MYFSQLRESKKMALLLVNTAAGTKLAKLIGRHSFFKHLNKIKTVGVERQSTVQLYHPLPLLGGRSILLKKWFLLLTECSFYSCWRLPFSEKHIISLAGTPPLLLTFRNFGPILYF